MLPLRWSEVLGDVAHYVPAVKQFCLGVGVGPGEFGKAEGRTADPSTTLRSGRDDKFAWER